MLAPQQTNSLAHASRSRHDPDTKLIRRIASGDEEAVGVFVDRWMSSFFKFTDSLRLSEIDGDIVAEEVFRRVMFEAPRFAAKPDKFADWLRGTIRDCAAATVLKGKVFSPLRGVARAGNGSPSRAAISCSSLLRESRVAEALSLLNSLTPYRFTAIYRIDGMSISNVHLFDRATGVESDASVSPVSQTYCLWIQETLSVVQMGDSFVDPRALGHPKQLLIRSYCGGPIRNEAGDLLGTICHFDYESRETVPGVLADLEAIGPLLAGVIAPERILS